MHHYPFHPGDYTLSTNHWSEERAVVQCEVGLLRDLAYRRLIDLYYSLEGPIPNKTHWVATRVRMVAHTDIVGSVLKEKFVLDAGQWRNEKCDKEIAKYLKRVVANQENGKKGGRKPTGVPNANPLGSKPRTRTKNQLPPLPPEGVQAFELFWNEHPRKVGKPKALAAFTAAVVARGAKPEDVLTGLRRHLPAWNAKKAEGEGDKIPHPTTWLNRDGWNDEVMSSGAPAGDADRPSAWWTSRAGLERRGMDHGLPAPPKGDADPGGIEFARFKASLYAKEGDGPWLDAETDPRVMALAARMREESA